MAIPQRIGQLQWGDLLIGPGTGYHVQAITGIDDLPEVRNQDIAKSDAHGDYTGPDYVGPRVVQLALNLIADDPDTLRQMILDLRRATQPGRQPADLRLLDWGVSVSGKIRRRSIPYDAEQLWRTGSAALEWYCADPYLYGLDEQAVFTTAYSPAAGRTYPLAYATVPVRTNLTLNPSQEGGSPYTATDNYDPATTGALTRTADTSGTGAAVGVASGRTNFTGSSGTTFTLGWTRLISSQPAGTTLTASAYVTLPTGSGITGLSFRFLSSAGTLLGTATVAAPLIADGQPYRYSGTYTLTAGQTCDRVAVAATGPGGSVFWSDAQQVETGATLTPYIDGNTTATWNGTPNASTSTRSAGTGRVYGATGSAGTLTATNNGDSPAYPVLRLDGPVANPSIEQPATGAHLVLDTTLQAGDYLLIDTRSRAVLYQGTTPRRTWVRGGSTWPLLVPGDNQLIYRGAALPGAPGQTSLLTVTWRDTSL